MTKAEQRRAALSARRALSVSERAAYSRRICSQIASLAEMRRGAMVLSYLATPEEVDLTSLEGFHTAYPVCRSGGVMEAYIPGEDDPLTPGCYGIREPDVSRGRLVKPPQIDVVLAPCVAFDEKCRRLGHGGGYYDRYLTRCENALVIAAAFETQKLPAVVTDEYDIPADIVVTEKGVYRR